MSGLRSALEELQAEDLERVESHQLEADLVELERVDRILKAERLRRVAEIDRRGAYRRDGYLSASSWVANRLGIGAQAAGGEVRMARALRRMPLTRAALSAGEVSGQATNLLVRARDGHPTEFEDDEAVLLEGARQLPVRDLFKALEHWQQAVDPAGAAEEEELRYQKRFLHISRTLNGTVRLDGELDPETGEVVMTTLRAVQETDASGSKAPDLRSGPQRRADALGEVCRQWSGHTDRSNAGDRPHMTVTVDVESLKGHVSDRSEYAGGQPVSPDAARRIACDAAITRVVTSGRSEPIDVGRRTAIVPPVTRRALIVRDRHCTFPGCGRSEEWCDAHHVDHWADGGATTLSNLILLCRAHHRAMHQPGGLGVRMERGRPTFYRSDGTRLSDPTPP